MYYKNSVLTHISKKHAYKVVLSFFQKTYTKKNEGQWQNIKWKIRLVKVWQSRFMLELCYYFIKLALHCYCGDSIYNTDIFKSNCLKESIKMTVKKTTEQWQTFMKNDVF